MQVFVTTLGRGRTRVFNVDSHLSSLEFKKMVCANQNIACVDQVRVVDGKGLPFGPVYKDSREDFHSAYILLHVRGGKGGFGALLRNGPSGFVTARPKISNNFDACRDLQGRRLRHAHADKNLKSWHEKEEERRKRGAEAEREGTKPSFDANKFESERQSAIENVQDSVLAGLKNIRKRGVEQESKRRRVSEEESELTKRLIGEEEDKGRTESRTSSVAVSNAASSAPKSVPELSAEGVAKDVPQRSTDLSTTDVPTGVDRKPINVGSFGSVGEIEKLGGDALKAELMRLGLKCGGTVQQRAARLFLLKTTDLEDLPKKHFVKKTGT